MGPRAGVETGPDVLSRYPTEVTLKDGSTALLAPMDLADQARIVLHSRFLDPDDLLFLREDIRDASVVERWGDEARFGSRLTLVADVAGTFAGYATLTFEPLVWTRGVGEIQVLVHPPCRGKGIARALTAELVRIAPELSLRKLTAQMTDHQTAALQVFVRLGFVRQAVLPGWVTDGEGWPRDLIVLARDLAAPGELRPAADSEAQL